MSRSAVPSKFLMIVALSSTLAMAALADLYPDGAPAPVVEIVGSGTDGTQKIRVGWTALEARLPDLMIAHAHPLSPDKLRVTIKVDGQRRVETGEGAKTLELSLPKGQHDFQVEFWQKDRLVHQTPPALLEATQVQTIEPESFSPLPLVETRLPGPEARAAGVSPGGLTRLADELSREKVVWVLPSESDPSLGTLAQGGPVKVVVDLSDEGKAERIHFRASKSPREIVVPGDRAFIKVDAAFNGNSFFWDDMFVSLETSWHLPALAERTLDFWYAIQREHGGDVIPREVRKSNRLSYNPAERTIFGVSEPNGAYTNPNLSTWVEWQLYSLRSPSRGGPRLPRAADSFESYLRWLEGNRRIDTGKTGETAYWWNNLGSGMDNIGRCGDEDSVRNRSCSWVDLLAQIDGSLREVARMHAALGHWDDARRLLERLVPVTKSLDAHWSPEEGLYLDRMRGDGAGWSLDHATPTVAGLWPLWAGDVESARVDAIIGRQLIPGRFGGPFPFPALSEAHPLYSDEGHYWLGGRWPNVAAMVMQGLESSGRPDVAAVAAKRYLRGMEEVSREYAETHGRGSVFEFYGFRPGSDGGHARIGYLAGHVTRADFAGWGAVPPIQSELRHWIGLRPVAGFAGRAAEIATWEKWLTTSALFESETFWRFNPFRARGEQKRRAADGFLEWNLTFDPGDEGTEVRGVIFHESRLDELSIRRVGQDLFELSIKSPRAIAIQINRLFTSSAICRAPLAASPIVLVGGGNTVRRERIRLRALPASSAAKLCSSSPLR